MAVELKSYCLIIDLNSKWIIKNIFYQKSASAVFSEVNYLAGELYFITAHHDVKCFITNKGHKTQPCAARQTLKMLILTIAGVGPRIMVLTVTGASLDCVWLEICCMSFPISISPHFLSSVYCQPSNKGIKCPAKIIIYM